MRLPLLAAIAVCVALPVKADSIARQGDDWVRLMDKPCTNEHVVKRLPADSVDQWSAAEARLAGVDYSACWQMQGGAALLMYEDGDNGIVPKSDLKPVLSI